MAKFARKTAKKMIEAKPGKSKKNVGRQTKAAEYVSNLLELHKLHGVLLTDLKKQVKDFWNKNSMSYNIEHKRESEEFYKKIDDLFFELHKFGHDSSPIFSKIIDYKKLKDKLGLEGGCG